MLIKTLNDITTTKEKTDLQNVRWGKLTQEGGKTTFTQRGTITGIWKFGCQLVTRHNLIAGERIWIKALDDAGQIILSMIGTVTWNENCFRIEGYRCEVSFREA